MTMDPLSLLEYVYSPLVWSTGPLVGALAFVKKGMMPSLLTRVTQSEGRWKQKQKHHGHVYCGLGGQTEQGKLNQVRV